MLSVCLCSRRWEPSGSKPVIVCPRWYDSYCRQSSRRSLLLCPFSYVWRQSGPISVTCDKRSEWQRDRSLARSSIRALRGQSSVGSLGCQAHVVVFLVLCGRTGLAATYCPLSARCSASVSQVISVQLSVFDSSLMCVCACVCVCVCVCACVCVCVCVYSISLRQLLVFDSSLMWVVFFCVVFFYKRKLTVFSPWTYICIYRSMVYSLLFPVFDSSLMGFLFIYFSFFSFSLLKYVTVLPAGCKWDTTVSVCHVWLSPCWAVTE